MFQKENNILSKIEVFLFSSEYKKKRLSVWEAIGKKSETVTLFEEIKTLPNLKKFDEKKKLELVWLITSGSIAVEIL